MGRKRKRDNHALSKRREDVSALYLSGMSQRAIAESLGVNQATISRDITSLNAEWVEQARANLTGYKAVHLKRPMGMFSQRMELARERMTGEEFLEKLKELTGGIDAEAFEREHELEPPGLPHWDEQMHEASVSLEKLWEEE